MGARTSVRDLGGYLKEEVVGHIAGLGHGAGGQKVPAKVVDKEKGKGADGKAGEAVEGELELEATSRADRATAGSGATDGGSWSIDSVNSCGRMRAGAAGSEQGSRRNDEIWVM